MPRRRRRRAPAPRSRPRSAAPAPAPCAWRLRAHAAPRAALGLLERLALEPQLAARLDHAAQHVVRELDAAHVEPLLDAQQPPVHERGQRIGRGAGIGEGLEHALLGQALAEAGVRQQLVLDHLAQRRRLIGERALVELGQDGVVRAGEQVGGDLGAALRDARVVELAADQRQQRGLDLGVAQFGAAGDEAHDRLRHFLRRPACRPACSTAASACWPFMRASRMRFCVIDGITPFTLSRCAR